MVSLMRNPQPGQSVAIFYTRNLRLYSQSSAGDESMGTSPWKDVNVIVAGGEKLLDRKAKVMAIFYNSRTAGFPYCLVCVIVTYDDESILTWTFLFFKRLKALEQK
jgi:hypothetical protein